MAIALEGLCRRIGGDSVEVWARRELAVEREAHRGEIARAAAALAAGAERSRRGRASGVLTAVGSPQDAGPAQPTPAPSTSQRPEVEDEFLRDLRRSRRRRAGLAAALALAAATAAVAWLGVIGESSTSPVAVAPADGAPTTRVDLLADAASPAPVAATSMPTRPQPAADAAAMAVDAGGSRVAGGQRSARRPRDARTPAPRPTGAVASAASASAAETAPPAGVQTHGYITFGAEPYAIVRLDGVSLGATPIFRRKVPIGRHEVELVTPDTGEVRLRRVVDVEDGALHEVIVP
jgi:hypothetical protein